MRIASAWGMCLLLAGCGSGATGGNAGSGIPSPVPMRGEAAATPPAPAATPSPTPVAPETAEAAAEVVRRYHALIAARRFADAYRLWEPESVGTTEAAFAARFAGIDAYEATVGAPGRVDSGAGQRYVTIPVRIVSRSTMGGATTRNESTVLHRVADIDGATPEQRRWRIRSSETRR